jgi:anti-anti-sigma factor
MSTPSSVWLPATIATLFQTGRVIDGRSVFCVRMGIADQSNFGTAGGITIDDLLEAAIGRGRVYADKQLVVTRTLDPYGLMFSGEIDVSNCHVVAECLSKAYIGDDDLHLDVSGLIFGDISGIRAFVDAAEARGERRLMLHGLPELLQTVMRVTGWADLPNLRLCNCTGWNA